MKLLAILACGSALAMIAAKADDYDTERRLRDIEFEQERQQREIEHNRREAEFERQQQDWDDMKRDMRNQWNRLNPDNQY